MSFFNWVKGSLGEWAVNVTAQWNLDSTQYHLIKNVTLPTDDGTTQIDHIIVSLYGLFVVETKHLKGWIFGGSGQKFWTQSLFKQKNKFQNPVHQNYKHVKTLESLLNIYEDQIFSVVVFVGEVTFKTKMPENVIFRHEYTDYIKSKQSIIFNTSEVDSIISQITNGKLTNSFKTNREHVQHVKSIKEIPFCKKCGSVMVKREAKKGHNKGQIFWGCSSFPKCRSVVNID